LPPKLALQPLVSLFIEVATLANRLHQTGKASSQQIAPPAGGQLILQLLQAHGFLTVPQIARLAGTSRQNIQTWVNRLEVEGHLELANNPAHKRSSLARLTARGTLSQASFAKQEVKLLERLSSAVSSSDVLGAVALLRRVKQLLAGAEESPPKSVQMKPTPKTAKTILQATNRRRPVSKPLQRKNATPPTVIPEETPSVEEEFPFNLL
jgi:DNA-binding MarR family transcriptional regulator